MIDGEPHISTQQLLTALQNPQTWTQGSKHESRAAAFKTDAADAGSTDESAQADAQSQTVVTFETHISWVFLIGDFAFKVKKPIQTGFLDFRSLQARQHFCEEELRLNRRYAADLYLEVVEIRLTDGQLTAVGNTGQTVEYAVRMRRFPDRSLLSDRLQQNCVSVDDLSQLAQHVAEFHQQAAVAKPEQDFGDPVRVLQDALDNFRDLQAIQSAHQLRLLDALEVWTRNFFKSHRQTFQHRLMDGRIRECHGDLHSGNVVQWQGQLTPFDGIEFSPDLRWIDVLNDVAFLFMDLFAKQRSDLAASFINAWLEHTGDYQALPLLRFYAVYRALVRAKVALIQAGQTQHQPSQQQPSQHQQSQPQHAKHVEDCHQHIQLADQLAHDEHPELWITHGLSGSGKTTVSNAIVQQHAAIRVRSDVERKRLHDVPVHRQADAQAYSSAATAATYDRLLALSDSILQAGYAVVVDATFLQQAQRQRFRDLAHQHRVPFAIAHCEADVSQLEQRLRDRANSNQDASDADVNVLHQQLKTQEELTAEEWKFVAAPADMPTQPVDSASQS